MGETRRNILVGLFMIFGLGALGFLMLMFGEAPNWLGGAEYELKIYVNGIAGIDDGSPIHLNGIKIGRVTELTFRDMSAPEKGVVLVGKIKKEFSVPRGAHAECVTPTLGLGRGRVDIYAAGAGQPAIEPGGYIQGESVDALKNIIPESMVSSLEGTVTKIGNFAETLTPVADDLHELLKKRPVREVDLADPEEASRISANLYTAVERLDLALKHFNEVLGDPQVKSNLLEAVENVNIMTADGRAAVADFRDTAANLKADSSRIADKLEGAVDNANARVTQLADAAMPVLNETAQLSANLNVISRNIRDGEGTIGRLVVDGRLYEVAVLSFERFTDMVDSIRRLAFRWEKTGRIGIDAGGFPVTKKVPE
jgi:phospholipid/cholesterol/gamma-HCH transport system substrate-binding protein